MTCAEFEAVLPDLLEGGGTGEQRTHLTVCAGCSELVSEIHFISQQARMLRSSDEPSPRVWNSIEIALRQEGLIREPGMAAIAPAARPFRQWTLAWLLPTTAAFLLTFGLLRLQHPATAPQVAVSTSGEQAPGTATEASVSHARTVPRAEQSVMGNDDQQLLDVVANRAPAMRASYETELQDVNSYIRDAERSARANPDDEEAQQYLMNAYEQKAMVYELAMDRSLP